jgi:hydrogenase maturation protease
VGVGNPLLGDDGVGNHVAKLVKQGLQNHPDADVKEVSASGIELIEEITGYDAAIIVDAIATKSQVGVIHKLSPEQLNETVHPIATPHAFNFASAYKLGKHLASKDMPTQVTIYAIEIEPSTDFSEKLSPNVERAAQQVATEILETL